jgi:hypothetical protein
MKVACPACGAEVKFKSSASVFAVCSHCASTLVRHDDQIKNQGKMSALPQDLSPLQIGTTGVFKGSKFEVVGRQRIGWENGSWNEWYLFFDNGSDGWLADAQGNYMISLQVRESGPLPKLTDLHVSQTVSLAGTSFSVEDMREVTCVGSQGELPVASLKGRKSTSVDLIGPGEKFANLDFSEEETRFFLGQYLDFDAFRFLNLRELDGW